MNKINIPDDIIVRKKKSTRQKIPDNFLYSNKNEIPDKIIIYFNSKKINFKQIHKTILFKYEILKKISVMNINYWIF